MTDARESLSHAETAFVLSQSERVHRAVGGVRRTIGYPRTTEQAWMLWIALSLELAVRIEDGADQETLDELQLELQDTAGRCGDGDDDALPAKALDGWVKGRRAMAAGAPANAYRYVVVLLEDKTVVARATALAAKPTWDEVERAHAGVLLELCTLLIEVVRTYRRPLGRSPFERPDLLAVWTGERGGLLAQHRDAPPWARFSYYRELVAEARERGDEAVGDLHDSAVEALELVGRLPLTGSWYPRAAEAAALL